MTALKDAIWSASGSQVLHIVLTFFDHYVKGKVFSTVVSGAPELWAGSSNICRAFPQKQGEKRKDYQHGVVNVVVNLYILLKLCCNSFIGRSPSFIGLSDYSSEVWI